MIRVNFSFYKENCVIAKSLWMDYSYDLLSIYSLHQIILRLTLFIDVVLIAKGFFPHSQIDALNWCKHIVMVSLNFIHFSLPFCAFFLPIDGHVIEFSIIWWTLLKILINHVEWIVLNGKTANVFMTSSWLSSSNRVILLYFEASYSTFSNYSLGDVSL